MVVFFCFYFIKSWLQVNVWLSRSRIFFFKTGFRKVFFLFFTLLIFPWLHLTLLMLPWSFSFIIILMFLCLRHPCVSVYSTSTSNSNFGVMQSFHLHATVACKWKGRQITVKWKKDRHKKQNHKIKCNSAAVFTGFLRVSGLADGKQWTILVALCKVPIWKRRQLIHRSREFLGAII